MYSVKCVVAFESSTLSCPLKWHPQTACVMQFCARLVAVCIRELDQVAWFQRLKSQ